MLSGWDWFLAKQLQCKTYWRRFHAAVQVYKVLHKFSPSYLNGTFHYDVDITLRTGQNLYRLFVPRLLRLNIVFTYRGHKFGILSILFCIQPENLKILNHCTNLYTDSLCMRVCTVYSIINAVRICMCMYVCMCVCVRVYDVCT